MVTSYQETSYTVMCGRKLREKSPKEFQKSVNGSAVMQQNVCLGIIIITYDDVGTHYVIVLGETSKISHNLAQSC